MKNGGVQIKKQNRFPYIQEYKKRFPITKDTIFVYKDTIYTDKKEEEFYYDVVHHEIRHLHQQKEHGADNWINRYINEPEFRLEQEVDAYRYQLKKVLKTTNDKGEYLNILTECITNLSSPLYGNIISYAEAERLLKIK